MARLLKTRWLNEKEVTHSMSFSTRQMQVQCFNSTNKADIVLVIRWPVV